LALDLFGPTNPPSRQKWYILVCIYYVTKGVEAREISFAPANAIISFPFDNTFTHFVVLTEIVTDRGTQFTSKLVQNIMEE